MRREILFLTDIVDAADHVAGFVEDITLEQFEQSELVRSAVAQKLAIIGEAAGRISTELKIRATEIPWPRIVAFRNLLVHAYFGIDWVEVWQVAKHRCPDLRDQVARILAEESARPE